MAATALQAKQVLFAECANFARGLDAKGKELWVRENINTIEDKRGKSLLKVLSSDKNSAAGYNANLVVYDEIASWGAGGREVWDQLQSAGRARINSLQIAASTPQQITDHFAKDVYDNAKRIKANPDLDKRYYPCIYECPSEEWEQPTSWLKANPACGTIFKLSDLEDDYRQVQNDPKQEFRFKTLSLGIWCQQGAGRAFNMEAWNKGRCQFNLDDFKGLPAYIGIDWAWTRCLASAVIMIPWNDCFYYVPHFWMPANSIVDRTRTDRFPYQSYLQNNLHLCPGDVNETKYLREMVLEACSFYDIQSVYFDQYGLEDSRQQLEFEGVPMVQVTQNANEMVGPTAFFEKLIIDEKVKHNNPILDWNVSNCEMKPVKADFLVTRFEETQLIDGAVAAILATKAYLDDPTKYASGPLAIAL